MTVEKKTTDFGFTQVNIPEKQQRIKAVFDSVAPKYDLMNDMMSMGVHRLWKRHAISMLQVKAGQHVLDLAGGTGDLSILMAPKVTTRGKITLSDINHEMLGVAKTRLLDHGLVGNIDIVQANAEELPFPDNTFDRVIMAFGLRNVTHKDKALASICRVLKPGGRLIVLEFSHPTSATFSKIYDLYSFHVLPLMGKLIAKDADSYKYLAESIRMHPTQEKLKEMVLTAGFDQCEYFNLTGGVVAIHQGLKY